MKDYTHYFSGYGRVPSSCNVYILNFPDGEKWIGFENTGNGTSVTNASEQLATEIVKKELFHPEKCRFFEWYSEYEGDVDEITYTWSNNIASDPVWRRFCNADKNPFIHKY
jgi:hypothetical protein